MGVYIVGLCVHSLLSEIFGQELVERRNAGRAVNM